jgi:hypothetical protein
MQGDDLATFDGLGFNRRELFLLLAPDARTRLRRASFAPSPPLQVSGAFAIQTEHHQANILLNGGFYPVTAGSPEAYPSDFVVTLTNNPAAMRGKLISLGGLPKFILWPGQTLTVFNAGTAGWIHDGQNRWNVPPGTPIQVDPSNGRDTDNDGLGTGAGAMATIDGAFLLATEQFMANGGGIAIMLADGTYSTAVNFNGGQVGSYLFSVGGAPGHTANVVMTGEFALKDFVAVGFNNMTFAPSEGCGICVDQNGIADVASTVAFASAPNANHMAVSNGGIINANQAYTINGGSVVTHWYATYGGRIMVTTPTINIAAPLEASTAFAMASGNSLIAAPQVKFAGSGASHCTGQRYIALRGAGIATGGAGTDYLPGSIAGTATAPAWYA